MEKNYDCMTCTRTDCPHRNSVRRLPRSRGGLDCCPGHVEDRPVEDRPVEDRQTFADLMRRFENAYAAGVYTDELYALATACALSVVKKCADPQRKTALDHDGVSHSGLSPAMVALRRGIVADMADLEHLDTAARAAYAWHYNKNGKVINDIADPAAAAAVDMLADSTLSDGMDLIQTAAAAILDETVKYLDRVNTPAPGWMEVPYTDRQVNRRVLINDDGAQWQDVVTTPIQETYRAVRRDIAHSRAIQTDPRNGYTYLEDVVTDPNSDATETIYRRLQKWADIGGKERYGNYTVDMQSYMDYDAVLEELNLTPRQCEIIRLRMSGYGYKSIATRLGVDKRNITITVSRIAERCEKIGFTPDMWVDITGRRDPTFQPDETPEEIPGTDPDPREKPASTGEKWVYWLAHEQKNME